MAKKYTAHENFIGGLNMGMSPRDIADNEISDGRSMMIDSGGELITRWGTEAVTAMDEVQKSIYRFYQTSLGRKILLTTGGTNIYHDGVSVFNAATANQTFFFENYHDTLYMVNTEDGLLEDNGTSIRDVTGSVLEDLKLIDLTQKDECLYVLEKDGTIWESGIGAPTTFDGNSFKRLPLTDGAEALRIKSHLSGNLAIYTTNDIYVLRGEPSGGTGTIAANTYSLDILQSGFGLIAPKTLVIVDGEHVGLSRNGAFVFTGSTAHLFPGWAKVKPIFELADPEGLENACAAVFDRKIFFSFPSYGSDYNDLTIVFDIEGGRYYPLWEDFSVGMYAALDGPDDTNELYFADDETARICKFNPNLATDYGTAISNYVITKEYAYGDPSSDKKMKKGKVRTNNTTGDIGFSYQIDEGSFTTPQTITIPSEVSYGDTDIYYYSSSSNPNEMTWKYGDGLGIKENKVTITGKGKYIRYKIQKDGKLQIINITPFWRPRRAK